ncbi:hypothetical protein [Amycolatopsis sp.]|jgi:hypothetical protein|uniref:hypothetical protein n=1 Tax=Amycolatopsis sp. TaxID=37632 RepID=UPI002DFBD72F|nr:hypothetical protein [Amycolatopsis sp.]
MSPTVLSETGWIITVVALALATITKALTSLFKVLAKVKAGKNIAEKMLEGSNPSEWPKIIRAFGVLAKSAELPTPRQPEEDQTKSLARLFQVKHNTPSAKD